MSTRTMPAFHRFLPLISSLLAIVFHKMLLIVFTHWSSCFKESYKIALTQILCHFGYTTHAFLIIVYAVKTLVYYTRKCLKSQVFHVLVVATISCTDPRMTHGYGFPDLFSTETVGILEHCFCDHTEIGIYIWSCIQIYLSPFTIKQIILGKGL